MENGTVPESQKLAKVIPIYKNNNQHEFSNYRPISLLPALSKVLEKVIHMRVYTFLTKENTLFSSQYGFRHGHSTSQAHTELLSDILLGFESNKFTLGLFLDLSKAFDTIDHGILLNKLQHYGIRGQPLDWFKSYLSNRKQYSQYNEVKSEIMQIDCGVPQGSVLGPLLFIIYMNDLPNVLQLCKSILFADDTTIAYTDNNLQSLFTIVNKELAKATDWFRANKLSINATKTHYVIFHARYMEVPDHDFVLKMGDEVIQRCEVVKFLGLNLDEKLEWSHQISQIESKIARSQLYILNSVKKNTTTVHPKNTILQPYILSFKLWCYPLELRI